MCCTQYASKFENSYLLFKGVEFGNKMYFSKRQSYLNYIKDYVKDYIILRIILRITTTWFISDL